MKCALCPFPTSPSDRLWLRGQPVHATCAMAASLKPKETNHA